MSLEIPFVYKTGLGFGSGEEGSTVSLDSLPIRIRVESEDELTEKEAASSPSDASFRFSQRSFHRTPEQRMREYKKVSGLVFEYSEDEFSELHKAARHAFVAGKRLWEEIESGKVRIELANKAENRSESCSHSISLSGNEFHERGQIMVIPCGLMLGSYVTIVGRPHWAHLEDQPKIALLKDGDQSVMVSQFMMELQGLNTVDGEDPPRILHLNPRLKGDWSGRPVIEQNTCYRMQWGSALRCEGWKSTADEDTVDGQVKCEKWIRDDDNRSEESKAIWWLRRLIGRTKKVMVDWSYPFAEDKLFVLTLTAGFEGYHINVDGRHVTSFPYRTGFTLEDATGTIESIKTLNVVARFFVALHGRNEVNIELMKEAQFFRDIVIVPYMDNYDLVVLKTVAICEYGVRTVAANYIMKCDDDTFVRIDAAIKEVKRVHTGGSLYVGNMNYYHKPLRHGKWAVTYEEWPEEEYPPYANGPGYIVSSDIAQYIVSEFEKHKLRLFKMEDVSMGMWVGQFNSSKPVEYLHNAKFCQFGCIEDYYTAHYQSPRQMICLWDKLQHQGKPQCCNMR
ncbi:hypothetical protein F0562_033712 [Nyssa sinensis]|uniref:Galectin domain-containing protein n=1 Tax=Nyssa sinensis TaxID=561372 RepID=A0A5J5AGZ5_9ASTE|nr:hypothetical protein F0562_033712 [Nyssa sinensis]